jgi:flagellar secretion chaperone FliS
MSARAVNSYHTVRTTTADPVMLTTMLYDGALKSVKKARLLQQQENRQRFVAECERTYLIIGELLATLDRSQGDLAESLAAVYGYCLRCIARATLGEAGMLDEVEKHIGRIADAWKIATGTLNVAPATDLRTASA